MLNRIGEFLSTGI